MEGSIFSRGKKPGPPTAQDIVTIAAHEQGIDEVLVIYTSKLEVRDWIGHRAAWNVSCPRQPLGAEKSRLLLKEWSQCALIVGPTKENFPEKLVAIEAELHKRGFYKAWAIFNVPLCDAPQRPSFEWFGIDIVSTLMKHKKNLTPPIPGDYQPWGVVLLE